MVAGTGLRELLLNGEAIRDALSRFVDARTEPWGIRITSVDIEDVVLPEAMQRAMARQAELRRQAGRAHASREDAGREFARQLEATAAILADQPHDVQVRFLQALSDARSARASVVVVPLPPELVQPFVDLQGRAARDGSRRSRAFRGEPAPAEPAVRVTPAVAGRAQICRAWSRWSIACAGRDRAFHAPLLTWWVSELRIMVRNRGGTGENLDRGSRVWVVALVVVGMGGAFALAWQGVGRMRRVVAGGHGLPLALGGIALRAWSVATLGSVLHHRGGGAGATTASSTPARTGVCATRRTRARC